MKMRKVGFLLAVFTALVLMVGCQRPYMKPLTQEIGTNETAFLVNLEGDSKDGQAKLDSIEYYEQAKVVSKRITINQRWQQEGRISNDGKWIPTQKLIIVDRTPATRLWYNEGAQTGDKRGIACETRTSVGITIGMQISGRIDEANAAKFVYYYKGKSLKDVMDTDVYAYTSSVLSKLAGAYTEEDLVLKKGEMIDILTKELNQKYGEFGITIYSIGMYGGIIFDNPDIQKAIDNKLIQEKAKAAAIAERDTNAVKATMLDYRERTAKVALLEAQAEYISTAAEKGIPLVPTTLVTDSRGANLLIDLNRK